MKELEVLRIFEAENGDVFFQHNNNYQERTKEEIKQLIKEASEEYENGNVLKMERKVSEEGVISYYYNNEFLANAGIHVLDKFVIFQNMIYLKRGDTIKKEKETEKTLKKVQNIVLKLAKN